MATPVYHIPALFEPALNGLSIKPDGVYVDVTFGGGGHSRGILSRLGPEGRLLGFDQDLDALANALDDSRFTFVHSNFAFLKNFVQYYGYAGAVDGILADLGVSFHHFDSEERGFSFRHDSPLDMRMNRRGTVTAASVLGGYSADQLATMFRLQGELKQSRRIAQAIVEARSREEISTTGRLSAVVSPLLRREREKKELSQVFQALRMEVNRELWALEQLLSQSLAVLKPGGRLAVITYHSLEDRLVKNFMRTGNLEGRVEKDFYGRNLTPWKLVNTKVIVPGEEEIASNPRSRSAKLRVAEKTESKDA